MTKNLLIVSPAPRGSTKGNRITADRWATLLCESGYNVSVTTPQESNCRLETCDVLIAIHARHCSTVVHQFSKRRPARPIVVCLSGTDIHRDISVRQNANAERSLDLADAIVLLEPECHKSLRASWQKKSTVIVQSAEKVTNPPKPLKSVFEVVVVGHLRRVKDPFLAAKASKLLPSDSRIRISQIGSALTGSMERQAKKYSESIPRYRWEGHKSFRETQRRIARSRLLVVSSRMEGGPNVVSEAIVNDIPILSTRIAASIGLLGADYPGLYSIGDVHSLAELMSRCETDRAFFGQLRTACRARKRNFQPSTEKRSWQKLVRSLLAKTTSRPS